jgi:hypothetical protein
MESLDTFYFRLLREYFYSYAEGERFKVSPKDLTKSKMIVLMAVGKF